MSSIAQADPFLAEMRVRGEEYCPDLSKIEIHAPKTHLPCVYRSNGTFSRVVTMHWWKQLMRINKITQPSVGADLSDIVSA